jgi:hypothetical protein
MMNLRISGVECITDSNKDLVSLSFRGGSEETKAWPLLAPQGRRLNVQK